MPTEEEIAAAKKIEDDAAAAKAKEEADAKAKADADAALGDPGKKAIQEERDARKAADKRAKDAEDRLAEIERADEQKKEDEIKAKGEFEKLATDRQTKLDEAKTTLKTLAEERDALAATVKEYQDRDRKTIDEGVKDFPDDLKDFDPGPDADLATRMAWFTKAQKHAADRVANPQNGNGAKPRSLDGKDPKAEEAARAAQARHMASTY